MLGSGTAIIANLVPLICGKRKGSESVCCVSFAGRARGSHLAGLSGAKEGAVRISRYFR